MSDKSFGVVLGVADPGVDSYALAGGRQAVYLREVAHDDPYKIILPQALRAPAQLLTVHGGDILKNLEQSAKARPVGIIIKFPGTNHSRHLLIKFGASAMLARTNEMIYC